MSSNRDSVLAIGKCIVTMPIEGLPFQLTGKMNVDGVEIDLHKSAYDHKQKPMASVEVESEVEMFRIVAIERIDKALAKIGFAYALPVKRGNEVYFAFIDPKPETPTKDWGWHQCSTNGKAYAVMDYQKVLKTSLSKLENMMPEKRAVFNKAAALYVEALRLENPTVALIVYFSSITAIARDTSSEQISTKALKETLRSVARMDEPKFSENFEQIYGNTYGRSAIDHGWADVTDPLTVGNATMFASLLRSWTRSLIQKYIDDNQIQH